MTSLKDYFRKPIGQYDNYDQNMVDTLFTTNLIVDQKPPARNQVAGDDSTAYIAPLPGIYDPSTNRGFFYPAGSGNGDRRLSIMHRDWYRQQLKQWETYLAVSGDDSPFLGGAQWSTRAPIATPNWMPSAITADFMSTHQLRDHKGRPMKKRKIENGVVALY